jgi:hypothetical protein
MRDGDRTKIEGEPTKRFRVWRTDINNEPHECEAEYDTVEEVKAHPRRLDHSYLIEVGRKFMTPSKFDEWAKSLKR